MKCQYVIISESFSLDAATGKVSLFHIIDRMQVVSTPFVIPILNFVALFEQEEDDPSEIAYELETVINNKVIATFQQMVFFPEGQKLNRNLTQLQGAVIPEIGTLSFRASLAGRVVGYWNIIIEAVGSMGAQSKINDPKPKKRQRKK